ncbi:MAG: hypothetical protein K2Q10_08465, partial [Rhodospirillales bacterium]|nr:hypothetical protein [Rhodospirillales bacterium]
HSRGNAPSFMIPAAQMPPGLDARLDCAGAQSKRALLQGPWPPIVHQIFTNSAHNIKIKRAWSLRGWIV